MKKIIAVIAAAALLIGSLASCGTGGKTPSGSGKPHIVATIFPEYDWVMNILGDDPAGADVTMLLDGFPRNVAQAEILEKTGATIRSAVLLAVPDAIIQDRIAGRRTCPNCKAGYHVKALPPKVEGKCDRCGADLVIRKDDNPETVKDRLVVYHQQTEPLIAYYKAKGLLRVIDGDQGPEKNAAAFKAAM